MTQWKEMSLAGGLQLRVPAELVQGRERGLDTDVSSWSGNGIQILVDQGPFADPLTSPVTPAGHESTEEQVGGRPARIVSYVEDAGTRVVAAHLSGSRGGARDPDSVTLVVRLAPGGPSKETALSILRSARFVEP